MNESESGFLSRAISIAVAATIMGITLQGPALATGVPSERMALVIGNASYAAGALENPRHDAADMAALLRQAGFSVDLRLDTRREELTEALYKFGDAIRAPGVKLGVFYYAGHGTQQSWRNFLIPVDANVQSASDVVQMGVDLSDMTYAMSRTRDRNFLVILDACRDDPFGMAYQPSSKGLSQYDAPAGSLLAYATGPGRVASDGEGRNGLYTGHLLQELAVKGARIEEVFKRVRLSVRLASRGRQIPWESTSLEENVFIFPGQERKSLSHAEQEKLLDEEIAAWRTARESNTVDALAIFLRQYPSGNVSELALARFNTLLRAQAPRPRLTRLHLPDEETHLVAGLPMKLATVASVASDTLTRRADDSARPTAVASAPPVSTVQVAGAEPVPAIASTPAALLLAAPDVIRPRPAESIELAALAPPAHEPALAVTASVASTALSATPPDTTVTVAAAVPPTPAPVPAQSMPAIAVRVSASAAPAAEPAVLEPLFVAATPHYQGAYEHVRQFKPGDIFDFRVINRFNDQSVPQKLVVTAVDAQKDEIQFNGGEYLSDSMGNILRNRVGRMSTPRQFYPAELYVGKKWTTMFRQQRPDGTSYTFQYKLKVVGKEIVTVPAGRFEAYKIEARGFNMQRGARLERNIWITPGINADIAHETTVRLSNGMIEQYDRQELVAMSRI